MKDLKDKDTIYVKNIDDEEEIDPNSMTFGKFCHQIWVAKITWLVSFAALFIVCVLGIQFGYTRSKKAYSAEGTVNFAGASTATYPDGTSFNPNDLVSLDSLQAVVDKNTNLKGIDVKNMVNGGDITVTKSDNKADISASGTNSGLVYTQYNNKFTVKILSKYFKNGDQAREFFTSIYNIPIAKATEINKSKTYNENLILSEKSGISYGSQLSYLSDQYDKIVKTYSSLITTYSDQNFTFQNTTSSLSQLSSTMSADYSNLKINNLATSINMNGYVKDPTHEKEGLEQEKTTLIANAESYQSELASQKKAFSDLYGTNPTSYDSNNAFATRISELTTLINNIIGGGTTDDPAVGSQLYYVNLKIKAIDANTYQAPSTVTDKITEITTFLSTATDTLTSVSQLVFSSNTNVVYELGDTVVSVDGGLSLPLNLLVSFAVGLLLGSIIAGVKGGFDEKKALADATCHQPEKNQEPIQEESETK